MDYTAHPCPTCDGEGTVTVGYGPVSWEDGLPRYTRVDDCEKCNGEGTAPCGYCGDYGVNTADDGEGTRICQACNETEE